MTTVRTPPLSARTTYGDAYGRLETPRLRSSNQPQYQVIDVTNSPVTGNAITSMPLVPYRGANRLDNLEGRLEQQEKTARALMDRAMKTKEDIIESLNYTHGSWQEEKYSREMLQEHIRSITAVVKRLSRDIENIEDQLKNKDSAATGTSSAVKNLEVHHIAGITDLRGRVARCDTSITRLTADIKNCYDTVKLFNAQTNDSAGKVYDRFQRLEQNIADLNNKLERSSMEHVMKIKNVEGDSTSQLSMLDTKTRAIIEDIRNSIRANSEHMANEFERLESKLMNYIDKTMAVRDNRLIKLEAAVDEWIKNLNSRIALSEEDINREKDRMSIIHKELDKKIENTISDGIGRQSANLLKLKSECREGFGTVHESITNMKTVMDGKRRLLEEQLKREIANIRKMVVLV